MITTTTTTTCLTHLICIHFRVGSGEELTSTKDGVGTCQEHEGLLTGGETQAACSGGDGVGGKEEEEEEEEEEGRSEGNCSCMAMMRPRYSRRVVLGVVAVHHVIQVGVVTLVVVPPPAVVLLQSRHLQPTPPPPPRSSFLYLLTVGPWSLAW